MVTERTARMDAEQHEQNMTAQMQTLTRNSTTQTQTHLTGLIDTKVWRKPGKLDATAKGGWNDWESVMLMNAMKNSAASETLS